ncbi:hypothetical protein [Clostridium uliginosum]|uniref:Glucose / Sorbosone dehydrogenase n=1 Tax=Clostridium uliginosum TaxID=119641 RepID=A0A1I1LY68_9CLOT|nr:hypothetical protein [Clostridium uliginosum]SFC78059.1 hypothetical protein SAMN05421842_10986 [Clostridium uliginosum]
MKRFCQFLIISVVIVSAAFLVFKFSGIYRVSLLKDNIDWSIVAKNCNDALTFDKDKDDNTYVAYENSIKVLKKDGREEILVQDKSLSIESLVCNDENLYFISKGEIYHYNTQNKFLEVILKDIPTQGKYLDRHLILKDSKLLLSIGAATNSGVAEKDDNSTLRNIPYDKTPINITLSGENYGKEKTGAFMSYKESSTKGQKISAKELGNASIIEIDLNTNKNSLYACGIRNIKGWDIDSKNNLIAITGGIENTGVRPVARDFDYIYKLEKGNWYGWPDFSGGDPITSPRFKGENILSPIILNPPNKVVSAPLYQFSKIGGLENLAIDKEGTILDKDSKVFYDKEDNMICSIDERGVLYRLLKLRDESEIKGIKYSNGAIYILDGGIGCIYKLKLGGASLKFNLPKSIWIFIISLLFILLLLNIRRINNKIKR